MLASILASTDQDTSSAEVGAASLVEEASSVSPTHDVGPKFGKVVDRLHNLLASLDTLRNNSLSTWTLKRERAHRAMARATEQVSKVSLKVNASRDAASEARANSLGLQSVLVNLTETLGRMTFALEHTERQAEHARRVYDQQDRICKVVDKEYTSRQKRTEGLSTVVEQLTLTVNERVAQIQQALSAAHDIMMHTVHADASAELPSSYSRLNTQQAHDPVLDQGLSASERRAAVVRGVADASV